MGITPINIGDPRQLQAQQALQAGLAQPPLPQPGAVLNGGQDPLQILMALMQQTGGTNAPQPQAAQGKQEQGNEKDGLPPGHGGIPPGHGGTPPGLAKKAGKGKGAKGKQKAGKQAEGGQQAQQQQGGKARQQQQIPPELGLLQAMMSMLGGPQAMPQTQQQQIPPELALLSEAGGGGAPTQGGIGGPMLPLSLVG